MKTIQVALSEIVFDNNLYPRKEHDPARVQKYAECLESMETRKNFMSILSDMRLLDGRHRHLAYLSKHKPEHIVTVFVHAFTTDNEAKDLAAQLNSEDNYGLTDDDKRRNAIRMFTRPERATQAEIASTLGVSKSKVNGWLKAIVAQEKKDREDTMWSMWLACYTQAEIAEQVGVTEQAIGQFLQESKVKFSENQTLLFRNFEPQIYTVWKFAKLTNKTKVFGSIPQEIIDNLLYYYTNPFDVVFDPFAGGGSTIDKCIERKRRYYASDLSPIVARDDIRQWDITAGLPDDLPVPDFVFLDPPYWKQAEGKYSEKNTDLSNIDLETFLNVIGNTARDIKRKWGKSRPDARLALIIGILKQDGEYVDLPFLCYQRIAKYLELDIRIQVPYSTQVHSGNYVKMAKEAKELLYLSRDLMVFGKDAV